MEDVQKKNGDLNFLDSLESSSEYDGSYSYEASEIEKVTPQRIRSNEYHCAPLDTDVQTNERSETPPLHSNSWASEMSLYDMLSPRKTLGSVRIPRTPAAIPTPYEFQRFNWKKMEYVLDSCTTNDKTSMAEKRTIDAASTGKQNEENEDHEEIALCYPCDSRDNARGETHQRLEYVDEEIAEMSKTQANINSDLLPSEPIFDYNNLLVNYLPPNMDSSMLRTLFSPYGQILSCKVVVDHPSGLSKGYGFVKFETPVDGIGAQRAMDKYQIGRKKLKVSFSRKHVRGNENKHQTNLYLSNLDPKMEPADLEKHFKACGYVVQCKILKNEQGVSKQIGFVRFDNSESAKRAIERFDGQQLEGTDRSINIRIAGTPRVTRGRESKLTQNFDFSGKSPPYWKSTRTACYVSGFDVTLPKRVLREVFEARGCRKVRNVRVIRRQHAPYAFVNFFNNEDAAQAASTLNNYDLGNCTLTVRIQT